MRDVFAPRKKNSFTEDRWKRVHKAANLKKEKKDGSIEGRTCADSRKQ